MCDTGKENTRLHNPKIITCISCRKTTVSPRAHTQYNRTVMDYRSILNFVNSPGADVQQPSPVSSESICAGLVCADPNNNIIKNQIEAVFSKRDCDHTTYFVNSPGAHVQQPSPVSSESICAGLVCANPNNNIIKEGAQPVCGGCCISIRDRWILKVGHQPYHMACLRCSMCLRTLDNHASCFIRDGEVYCRFHYVREFGTKCTGCSEFLLPTDWIQRARDLVYHVDCFRCYVCKRQLVTGDTIVARENQIVCYEHKDTILHMDEIDNVSVSSFDSDSRGSDFDERASKRPRTGDLEPRDDDRGGRRSRSTFTAEQLQILQATFAQRSTITPDEQEVLAGRVGLTKKVVSIWFQNARARNKKKQTSASQHGRSSRNRCTNSPIHTIVIE